MNINIFRKGKGFCCLSASVLLSGLFVITLVSARPVTHAATVGPFNVVVVRMMMGFIMPVLFCSFVAVSISPGDATERPSSRGVRRCKNTTWHPPI